MNLRCTSEHNMARNVTFHLTSRIIFIYYIGRFARGKDLDA